MTTYLALVRGINVAGKKVVMAELRDLFTALGHGDVRSYIQTGNVIFTAPGRDPGKLGAEVSARLQADLGVQAEVLIRTAKELDALVAGNPFVDRKVEPKTLYVTFLAEVPAADKVDALTVPAGEKVEYELAGRDVYLHYPDGYGRAKLNNLYLEKKLKVVATTRNWNVVTKLRDLMHD